MRLLTLRQVLRILVLLWIANLTFQIGRTVVVQVKEVSSEYDKIDPLLSESPNIYLFGGHMTIGQNTISESPEMVRKLAIRGSVLRNLSRFLTRLVVILVLLNIFQLLKTWNFNHFFIQNHAKIIRRISFIYLGWVVVYFVIYLFAGALFPFTYIEHYYNVITINYPIPFEIGSGFFSHIFSSIRQSINDEALTVFFLLYILSLSMKKGVTLQEQADLTI